MNQIEILKIVEEFIRKNTQTFDAIKVIRVPDWKSVFIEQTGDNSRSIMMSEFSVDGKAYWAGFSPYTQTVYVSGR